METGKQPPPSSGIIVGITTGRKTDGLLPVATTVQTMKGKFSSWRH